VHSQWEFYIGQQNAQFLVLPERLTSAYSCLELHASKGITIAQTWAMSPMPPATPVPTAPTYGGLQQAL
jgi:hypothetical protein